MYLAQAQSEYSEHGSEYDMDESSSSFSGTSSWIFGGRKASRTSGHPSASPVRAQSKRTSQQVLATARAVANDMSHPNQEEVRPSLLLWKDKYRSNTVFR